LPHSTAAIARKAWEYLGLIITGFALILQLVLILQRVKTEQDLSYLAELVRFFSYMTILSNILVLIFFLSRTFFTGSGIALFMNRPAVKAGLFIYIFIVFIVYHFVLAAAWDPRGWQLVADTLLHYIDPWLYMVYWLIFVRKQRLRFANAFRWLLFPLGYLIYTLIRGQLAGVYPYPFLDAMVLPWKTVIRNIIAVSFAYLVLGLLLIFINNLYVNRRAGRTTR
jgi:hypothetical protein